jgi:hypothetical protein
LERSAPSSSATVHSILLLSSPPQLKSEPLQNCVLKRKQAATARAAADLKPFISGYGRLGSQDGPFPGYQAGHPSSSRGPCRSVLFKLSKKRFFPWVKHQKYLNTKNAFNIFAIPPDLKKKFMCGMRIIYDVHTVINSKNLCKNRFVLQAKGSKIRDILMHFFSETLVLFV